MSFIFFPQDQAARSTNQYKDPEWSEMTTITSAIENHFEGPEKTLEIDWVPNVGKNSLGLRAISRDQWDGKFKLAMLFPT